MEIVLKKQIPEQNETFLNYLSHNITNNIFLTSTHLITFIDTAKKLKNTISSGIDQMSSKLVTDIMEDIACPLIYM